MKQVEGRGNKDDEIWHYQKNFLILFFGEWYRRKWGGNNQRTGFEKVRCSADKEFHVEDRRKEKR